LSAARQRHGRDWRRRSAGLIAAYKPKNAANLGCALALADELQEGQTELLDEARSQRFKPIKE
jgi:hypothetical protein